MKKKWYVFFIPFLMIIFSFNNVNAATVNNTKYYTISSGESIELRYQSYTNETYNEMGGYVDTNNQMKYYANWNLTENLVLRGLNINKYYSGTFFFRLMITPQNNETQIDDVVVQNTYVNDYVQQYVTYVQTDMIYILVVFDNYKPQDAALSLNTISFKCTLNSSDNTFQNTQNISTLVDIYTSSTLYGYDAANNNALTALMYNAITQGTNSNFQDIITQLSLIKSQDYTYYTDLVNRLATLHNDNLYTQSELNAILSDMNLDFAAVQTVLDLFPSYRTAVLQYWQDLLQMNAAQSSEAAEVESAYSENNNTSATLLSGMDGLQFPTVSAQNFNILGNVDSTQKTNFFGLIGTITNNGFITTMLLIIVTGAIVGFILYGKK